MRAAYELRLARKAHDLGADWAGTWGRQKQILLETQERLLAGEGDFRLSPFPYPGLRSFDPKEGKIFFGRERNVGDVQQRLANSGIVVVLGGSGSGKSSLVRAGLLPYLNSKRRIPGRVGSWYKAEFRPRIDPLSELADALADQVQLPLLDIEAPGLAVAMGLQSGEQGDEAKEKLRAKMRERFDAAKRKGREGIREALLDFVDRDLDHYDHLASEGMRVPGASLMLLLDQFEEVFRPEIDSSERTALLDLVIDLNSCLSQRNEKNERTYRGGLFLVVTMRSEELHRCAEHRGLAEVVNGSVYLLDLLDPENPEDAADLHKAIVEPARNVFDDWGLAYDRNEPDAPFAKGMPAWLLSGAGRRLEHQPDRLPLLQHALQATWHAAMRRWSKDGFTGPQLVITPEDLPGQRTPLPAIPDLGNCLSIRADKAADRAKERFAEKAGTLTADGEILLQAAARSLARRDDRGNWARRFAEMADIIAFLGADKAAVRIKERFAEKGGENAPREAVQDALNVFLMRGYLSGGNGAPYDISHEALIRNWPRFKEWLRAPESAARALERVVNEIDPRLPEEQRRQLILDWIPPSVSELLTPVFGPEPSLPRTWALQQLGPMLERSAIKERWQDLAPGATDSELAQVVLTEIGNIRQQADLERRQAEDQRYRQKLKVRGLIAAGLALIALGVAIWDNLQSTTIALYAAHAQSLTSWAGSDQGALTPPELRARVMLRAVDYIDEASERAAHRFLEGPANLLASALPNFSDHEKLPSLSTAPSLSLARKSFDTLTRDKFGRFATIKISQDPAPAMPGNLECMLANGEQSWAFLQDKTKPADKAFKIADQGGSLRLQFGVGKDTSKILVDVKEGVNSDLQITLATGARLCLSPDGKVLTLSSPGNNEPYLYELQWAPCLPASNCNSKPWRVRHIPLGQGGPRYQELPPKTFPCVTAIKHLDLETGKNAGPMSLGKLQVEFTAGKTSSETCSGSGDTYVAEFYTGLAVPRSVNAADNNITWFPCDSETSTCRVDIDKSTKYQNFSDPSIEINIRKRIDEINPQLPPILDVTIQDRNMPTRLSLPANQIIKAALSESGEEVLLRDDADMTWTFLVGRSGLEKRLKKMGCLGSEPQKWSKEEEQAMKFETQIMGDLANLYVDRACHIRRENQDETMQ